MWTAQANLKMLVQILVCIVSVFVSLLWIRRQRLEGFQPPLYPGAWPIVGHALVVVGVDLWTLVETFSRYTSRVGGIVRFYSLWWNYYFITDPEDSLTILNQSYAKSYIYSFANEWIGNGLVTADVPYWKKNRKLFNRAFTQRTLNTFLDVFNKQSRRLVDQLVAETGKGWFNPYCYIINNVLETSNETILGLKTEENSMMDKDYAYEVTTLFDMIVERIQNPLLHLSLVYYISDLRKRQYRVINKMKTITFEVIRKRKSELRENNKVNSEPVFGEHKTVLDFALEHFKESEGFTDDDIRQHLETFVIGSFDSTTSTLVYALNEIGADPIVQEGICKELLEVFGDSERDVDKEDLPKLIYLDAVIKEIVRMYPAVPLIARDLTSDVKLKNYTIPEGATCICSIYGINRHPSWGEDADQFRPDRWLKCKRSQGPVFAGFGLGKRNCIGGQYGLMSLKTMLVHILRRYRVKAANTKGKSKFNVFLKPASGYDIEIELR